LARKKQAQILNQLGLSTSELTAEA